MKTITTLTRKAMADFFDSYDNGDAFFLICDSTPHMSGGYRFSWHVSEYTRACAYRNPETGRHLEGEFVGRHETARARMLADAIDMLGGKQ